MVGLPILALASACSNNNDDPSQAPQQTAVPPPNPQGNRADNNDTQTNAAAASGKCEELGVLNGTALRAVLINPDPESPTQSVNFPLVNRPLPSRLAVVAVGPASNLVGKTVALGAAENANYESCTRCLVVAIGCGPTDCNQAAWFFPRSGNATMTATATSRNQAFDGRFEDVILEQVKIDSKSNVSRPVVGGACLHIQKLTFEATVQSVTGPVTEPDAGGGGSSSGSSSGSSGDDDDGGSSGGTGTSSGTGGGGGGGGKAEILNFF